MRVKSGSDVYSADGRKIGRVRGVIMPSGSDAVTGIIIARGFIFNEDRMIPVDWVAQTTEDGDIRLREEHQAFDELERFDETQYVAKDMSNPDYMGLPDVYYYGAAAYIPNAANLGPALAIEEIRHEAFEMGVEDNDITLRVGIEVVTSDDQYIGKVDEIIASPPENRLSHFVISSGGLFATRKMIPITWIAELGSERILLAVNREFMERLPDFDEDEWNTQGEEYANNYAVDNMNDEEDFALEKQGVSEAAERPLKDVGDPAEPRRADQANTIGVETSRSRDWERTGTNIEEATTPPDAQDNPDYQRENEHPIQGT
jgi:uncharacterized protein YrrD